MATKTAKTSTARYRRCAKCQARLSRSSESCQHCGQSTVASFPPPPFETPKIPGQIIEESGARSPERFDVAGRYLVIVNRDHHDLYSYLKTAFSGERGVQVIQERRTAERRGKSGQAQPERRRGDRRKRDGEAEVRKYGVAVVRTI